MKKILTIGLAALGLKSAECYYFFKVAFKRQQQSRFIPSSPEDGNSNPFKTASEHMKSFDYEPLSVERDGLKLQARFYDRHSDVMVLAMHGYRSTPTADPGLFFEMYQKMGYDYCTPYQRASGESEGDYITFGYEEKYDVLAWCKLLMEKNPNYKIILHGVSMGASTVLMAASLNCDFPIKVVIADCAYNRLEDELTHQTSLIPHLPKLGLVKGVDLCCQYFLNFKLSDVCVENFVASNQIPTLFIHGQLDNFVPYDNVNQLYAANASKKEILVIEDAQHAMSYVKNPVAYEAKVKGFIEENI